MVSCGARTVSSQTASRSTALEMLENVLTLTLAPLTFNVYGSSCSRTLLFLLQDLSYFNTSMFRPSAWPSERGEVPVKWVELETCGGSTISPSQAECNVRYLHLMRQTVRPRHRSPYPAIGAKSVVLSCCIIFRQHGLRHLGENSF